MILIIVGDGSAVRIFSWVGNSLQLLDVKIARHNHDPGRMLTGGPFDTDKLWDEAFDKSRPFGFVAVFIVLLNVAISRLIGNGSQRAGAEDIIPTKEVFCVFMGPRLVFTGEVQIDIRNFIPVESQKDGKRDIVAILDHHGPAFRASLVSKVKTGADTAIGKPLRMVAMRTAIILRKLFHNRKDQNGCDKRRTSTASGTSQVHVVILFID